MPDLNNMFVSLPIKPEMPLQVSLTGTGEEKSVGSGKESSFKDIVAGFLSTVNQLQLDADAKVRGLATGEVKNLHEVMVASEKASLAMQFTMQLRNRLIEAYQDILRTQV